MFTLFSPYAAVTAATYDYAITFHADDGHAVSLRRCGCCHYDGLIDFRAYAATPLMLAAATLAARPLYAA